MKHARNDGPDIAFRLARRVVATVADDMSTMQRVGAGIVAALVAITPFGAWSEVEAHADPLAAGTPVEVGPFEVKVVRVATVDEFAYLVPKPGNHLLGVVAEVTNTGEVPEYRATLGQAIPAPQNVAIVPKAALDELGADTAPDGGADPSADPAASADLGASEEAELPPATILSAKDGTTISVFNPGVTHRVALLWEQGGKWSGRTIPLEVIELEWIEESVVSLDNGYWLPNEVAYHGRIPVDAERPGAGSNQSGPSAEAGQP
ncbi:hypothetical protein [Promicromonospora soli]|uniref:Uncharacterized protein n=1 Tax=Promicromonospora soli TaxID=2035533 RepID=A0A919FU78_9MICO|nr:hypothetical protein [Promicromonospora soli]GHH72697.1 hypothetical protein GCM10017772_22680 [Promicromonospora soli]